MVASVATLAQMDCGPLVREIDANEKARHRETVAVDPLQKGKMRRAIDP
jgi:hypothetical protein